MINFDSLILCGGLGTRLKPVVPDRQKCVALVGGKPFLSFLLRQVQHAGSKRCILCAGHNVESVRSLITQYSSDIEIMYSIESSPLGTGGAFRQGLGFVQTDTVIGMNGDSICPVELRTVVEWHISHHADFTIVLSRADGRTDGGNVQVDSDGRILSFGEKSGKSSGYLNAGIYCFPVGIFRHFPAGPLSFEKDVIPRLLEQFRVMGYVTDLPLLDIGTPDRYGKAEEFLFKTDFL